MTREIVIYSHSEKMFWDFVSEHPDQVTTLIATIFIFLIVTMVTLRTLDSFSKMKFLQKMQASQLENISIFIGIIFAIIFAIICFFVMPSLY